VVKSDLNEKEVEDDETYFHHGESEVERNRSTRGDTQHDMKHLEIRGLTKRVDSRVIAAN
jgi:hypothetical protein